jgi:SnoaL-like protein
MDEQRVPDLEEMDEQQAQRFLEGLASDLSPEGEYAIRHEDYVMEMPQSGERFVGRENLRAFQEAFPDNADKPTIRIRRVLVGEGLWVAESVVDYGGGQVLHGAAILELKDGKVWRDTRYFAEPFEAPGWRAHLVERMEP